MGDVANLSNPEMKNGYDGTLPQSECRQNSEPVLNKSGS